MRKFLTVLLVLLVMAQICSMGVFADDYTYTVRVYAGNRGSISGGTVQVYNNVPYGTTISFDLNSVSVNDGRYYVQGIRHSGRDNDALQPTSITVTGDTDYVVAYGIKGTLVPYTVHYQDVDGRTLAASQTYYGNLGEKPVIAFLYIDGYTPQAYNLTKTLSDNPADNVFTFVYTQIVRPTPAPAQPSTTTPAPDNTDNGENAENPEDTENGEAPETPAENVPNEEQTTPVENETPEEEETEPEVTEAPEEVEEEEPAETDEGEEPEEELEEIDLDEVPQAAGPEEIIDLDDTPLGVVDMSEDAHKVGLLPLVGAVSVLCLALAGIATVLVLLLQKKIR